MVSTHVLPLAPPIVQAPSFESLFDPVELLGTDIPFVDPFSYDDRVFYDSGFCSSERPTTEKTPGSSEVPTHKLQADMIVSTETPNYLSRLGRRLSLHTVYAASHFSYSQQLPVSFESMYPRLAVQSLRPHLPALLSQEP